MTQTRTYFDHSIPYKKFTINSFIKIILIFSMLFTIIGDIFPFLSFVSYFVDIFVLILAIYKGVEGLGKKNRYSSTFYNFQKYSVILFFVFSFFGFLLNGMSPFLYVWGIRRYIKTYLYFFITIESISITNFKSILKTLDILFYVNIVVSLIEYLLGYRWDNHGGIFGVSVGCNAGLNNFLILMCTLYFMFYMKGKITGIRLLFSLVSSLVIASFAELKVFYLETVLLLLLYVLFSKFSIRKWFLFFFSIGALFVGMWVYDLIFPESSSLLSLEGMIRSITSSSYSGNDLGRGSVIPWATEQISGSYGTTLFGLGLGNCDYSNLSIFTSEYYIANASTHYHWFTNCMVLLETGYLGFICYYAFMLFGLIKSFKTKDRNKRFLFVSIYLFSLLLSFYNISLRFDSSSFIAFFFMAVPFIYDRFEKTNKQQIDAIL